MVICQFVQLSVCRSVSLWLFLSLSYSICEFLHLSICQSIYLWVYVPISQTVHLTVRPPVSRRSICECLCMTISETFSIYEFFYLCMSICLSVYIPVSLCVYQWACLSSSSTICQSSVYLWACLFLWLFLSVSFSLCEFFYLWVYLSVCLYVSLYVYLSICITVSLCVYQSFCDFSICEFLYRLTDCLSVSLVYPYVGYFEEVFLNALISYHVFIFSPQLKNLKRHQIV